MAEAPTTALDEVTWDLSHLLDGERAPDGGVEAAVDALLDRADELAEIFARAYEGHVEELDGPGLIEAMKKLAEISELAGRAANYAHLRFAADTEAPANGALLQRVSERGTAIQTKLLFFELEWVQVPDARAEELLATDGLEFCAHYLRMERRYRPHLLSKPEETIATELSVTGRGAWTRLFDELTSAIRVDLDGQDEPVSLDIALSRLFDPDRDQRRATAEAVTAALEPGLRTRAYVFNTLLQDKAIKDRLRSYPHWLAARNLSNEASDESVRALVEAVKGRYDLARRWYETKAKLLGLDRLADYDRMAAVTSDDEEVPWEAGRDLVIDSFSSFSEQPATSSSASSASTGSTPRPPPASAAEPSVPRPSPRSTPMCSSTTPASAGT